MIVANLIVSRRNLVERQVQQDVHQNLHGEVNKLNITITSTRTIDLCNSLLNYIDGNINVIIHHMPVNKLETVIQTTVVEVTHRGNLLNNLKRRCGINGHGGWWLRVVAEGYVGGGRRAAS